MTRFQTNKRLWLLLTLILWVAFWLIRVPVKGNERWTVGYLLWDGLRGVYETGFDFGRLEDLLPILIIFAVPALLASAAIAWVIHCPIVMLLSWIKKTPSQLTTDTSH